MNNTNILNYFPGQIASIYLETVDGYNVRTNAMAFPIVNNIILPSLTLAAGYPQNMISLGVGLYYFQFTLPSGAASVGNYLVNVSFINPINNLVNNQIYQIIVSAPFGNFGVTTG